MLITALFCGLFAFVMAFMISPIVFYYCRKLKAEQNILHYVEAHINKQGTPTIGGLIFIFGTVTGSFFAFQGNYTFALITIVVMISFGVLGFLDDYIKIKEKRNEGLKVYQKVIGQVGISTILAFFVYNFVGTSIYIPFVQISVNIGIFIIPLVILVFVSLVNSTNLIDGLDGLCASVSIFYLLGFVMLLTLGLGNLSTTMLVETQNLILVSCCLLGALLAFFVYNGYPALIFMGDTGSLAIGGFLSCIAVFTGYELYILFLGLPYVITSLSDIIQVAYYKKTKKRVFLMAPLHHHFEKKGVNENKIVIIYIVITILLGIITYTLTSYFGR